MTGEIMKGLFITLLLSRPVGSRAAFINFRFRADLVFVSSGRGPGLISSLGLEGQPW